VSRLVLVGADYEAPKPKDAVLAVDPGLTTGWALWVDGDVWTGQTAGQLAFADEAWGVLHQVRPVVVCEAYIITSETAKKSRQYEPLELIGTLRFLTHLLELEFELQTPTQAKRFSTDDKLKAAGWWVPGQGHGMDAARHLLRYMMTKRKHEALLNKVMEGLG
jgi:hypothetical protein